MQLNSEGTQINREGEGTMTDQEIKQLEKVHARAVNPKNKKADAAKGELEEFCQQHRIKLSDFIKDTPFDFDFSAVTESVTFTDKESSPKKLNSRRANIINLVTENIWDTNTLGEYLQVLGWPDLTRNKKAISGTLSGMKKDHGWVQGSGKDGCICIRMQ